MTTENKDFRVKNGLQVIQGGVFGGTVTAATPTTAQELTTKAYVDALSIESLTNLDINSPINNDILVYDGTNWTNVQQESFDPRPDIFMMMGA